MKNLTLLFLFLLLYTTSFSQNKSANNVYALKVVLTNIAAQTQNELLAFSCNSIIKVLNAENSISDYENTFVNELYNQFISNSSYSPKLIESYLTRQQSFIIAWESPSDGEVSFTWLKLPENWDVEDEYPIYIQLHGYWNVADNAIEYMTYPYQNGPASTYAFEDGYHISPWGRGNYWYENISETDIWECIAAVEQLVKTDKTKKYLCGHSMGGYGAYNIGQKTPNYWAAVGLHAAALWWNNDKLVNRETANKLSQTPVYFVCGTNDGLLNVNQQVYGMLQQAENPDLKFTTFSGGHKYRSEDVEEMYDWMSDYSNSRVGIDIKKENKDSDFNLEIYPNPANNNALLNIELNRKENVCIKVYNTLGKNIYTIHDGNLNQGKHQFNYNTNNLTSGIYFIGITSDNAKTGKRILIE